MPHLAATQIYLPFRAAPILPPQHLTTRVRPGPRLHDLRRGHDFGPGSSLHDVALYIKDATQKVRDTSAHRLRNREAPVHQLHILT